MNCPYCLSLTPTQRCKKTSLASELIGVSTCAGYLAYPFQNQEVNSHEETLTTPIWNVDCKEKHW